MAGKYGECFCKDLEIDGEFYGPCAVCETATVERLAQEELVQMMKEKDPPACQTCVGTNLNEDWRGDVSCQVCEP